MRGGLIALQSLSTIKKGTSPLNFQSNVHFFSFYYKALSKNLIYPQGMTYNPCPEGSEGVVILKGLISRTFNYIE
jgi:hypothetical protein